MKTTTINSNSDLAQFGVNPLTSEACPYGMRLLCDLSQEGAAAVSTFLGLSLGDTPYPNNWNSMVGDQPAAYSVMLPRSVMKDLTTFLLMRAGAYAVVIFDSGLQVGLEDDTRIQAYRELSSTMVHLNPQRDRNTHTMTGRTV